ncbi:hypothetical protein VTI74DRAFT_3999 [Chaetomium olivicolor]
MGPMKFPNTYKDQIMGESLTTSDHLLIFQLAEEMNRINRHHKNLSVDFINWMQNDPNGLVYKNGFKLSSGLPPTVAQIQADPTLGSPVKAIDGSTKAFATAVQQHMPALILRGACNEHAQGAQRVDENDLRDLDERRDTYINRKFERVQFTSNGKDKNKTAKVQLTWRGTSRNEPRKPPRTQLHTSIFHYALISAPFCVVRSWHLPSSLPTTTANAINNLGKASACKVALEYTTGFWEHLPSPFIGGCSTSTDIPGIETICYPSYNINGAGKATVLLS